MNLKLFLSLSLSLVLFFVFTVKAQKQLKHIKDPEWNILNDGTTPPVSLSDGNVALALEITKGGHAVVSVDDQLVQKWATTVKGVPTRIGRLKGKFLVISSIRSENGKSFTRQIIGSFLDEISGKILDEKTLYTYTDIYYEDIDFFLSNDGSYLNISVRKTMMDKRKRIIDFKKTTGYRFIEFDDQLNQKQVSEPILLPGEILNSRCDKDGNLMVISNDVSGKAINAAAYTKNKKEPFKTITIPFRPYSTYNSGEFQFSGSKKPLVCYLAVVSDDLGVMTVKFNFEDGTSTVNKEFITSSYIKELEKTFVPINKKFDDFKFFTKWLEILGIEEIGDQIVVSISPSKVGAISTVAYTIYGGILLNFYNQDMKKTYHQFVPRTFLSMSGIGGENIAFRKEGNLLKMVSNLKNTNLSDAIALYMEMDLNSGEMKKMVELPKDPIKNRYYSNPLQICWLKKSFILPFTEDTGGGFQKPDLQFLQFSYD